MRRLENFCGNPRRSLRSTTQKAAGRVRLVLLPSLIAQIPAFSVMRRVAGVSRRSISLAVDFLSSAERHAGSEVSTPSGFLRSNARAYFLCSRARLFVRRASFSRRGVNRPQSNATGLKLLSQSPQLMSDTETTRLTTAKASSSGPTRLPRLQ